MRVGLLGGTFNPPHCGHLKLAELALEALGLDQVRFIPTAAPAPQAAPGRGPGRRRPAPPAGGGPGRPAAALPGGAPGSGAGRHQLHRGHPGGPGGPGTRLRLDLPHGQRPAGRASRAGGGPDGSWNWPPWRWRPGPGARSPSPPILAGRTRPRWSGAPGELVWLPGTGLDLASTELREELGRGETPPGIPPQVMAAILRETTVPLNLHGRTNDP